MKVQDPDAPIAAPRPDVIDALALAAQLGMMHSPMMENCSGAEVTCAALTMALRIVTTAVSVGANRAQLRQAIGALLLVCTEDAVH